jgi:hypothetical protein
VAVLGDETYFRIVNTRSATAACDALAEAIGQEYLGLPIAVVDLDTRTSYAFRVTVRLVRPRGHQLALRTTAEPAPQA